MLASLVRLSALEMEDFSIRLVTLQSFEFYELTAGIIEKHLPPPHTTRPGGADQDEHPERVKARRGGIRAEVENFRVVIKFQLIRAKR